MAGKPKKNVEGPTSKTARASLAQKGIKDNFKASADMNRIISLAGGEFAYVLDPRTGNTYHLRRGSQSWGILLDDLLAHPEWGPKIADELNDLGW